MKKSMSLQEALRALNTPEDIEQIKKSSIKESYVVDTDNRDASTTVLELDNGDTVEVDPCELFANMLANNYEDGLSLREIEDIVNNYLDAEDAGSIKVRIMIE